MWAAQVVPAKVITAAAVTDIHLGAVVVVAALVVLVPMLLEVQQVATILVVMVESDHLHTQLGVRLPVQEKTCLVLTTLQVVVEETKAVLMDTETDLQTLVAAVTAQHNLAL